MNGNITIKEKKSKGPVIIIIILVLVIVGLSTYILSDKGIIFTNKEEKTESNKKNTTTKTDKNTNSDDNTTKEEDTIKPLDLSKCLNNSTNTYSNQSEAPASKYGLSMSINQDKMSVTLNIDWATFGPISGATAYVGTVKTYQITGFTSKVKSAYIGDVGQDATGITLFFLMEDSTVSYMPMFIWKQDTQGNIYQVMNYTNDNFIIKGVLPTAKDVINLYTVNASNGSGWITTIAATKDGSFYDLGELFNNKDY